MLQVNFLAIKKGHKILFRVFFYLLLFCFYFLAFLWGGSSEWATYLDTIVSEDLPQALANSFHTNY